jgi:hypothetical protein
MASVRGVVYDVTIENVLQSSSYSVDSPIFAYLIFPYDEPYTTSLVHIVPNAIALV